MRILTVLGTRPEIIRLSVVIELLDTNTAEHILLHTGQNYAEQLDAVFFRELGIRAPDVQLGVRATGFAEQVGQILTGVERVILERRPERLLVLGDTNSGLSAMVARRLGIPVYHMEAGNRCFDDRVPEEVNRRIIDHSSSVLLPYTGRSRDNLVREGIDRGRIFVTGNPIKQVMERWSDRIACSTALRDLALSEGSYFLVTLHRAENVDREDRLREVICALERLHKQYGFPVICSLHPRTRSKAERFGIDLQRAGIQFLEPLGFFNFLRLEQSAFCLLSDSGTVQEEACILGVPNVTLREVTERPETVECGSNVLAGTRPENILRAVAFVSSRRGSWLAPAEYLQPNVAETVVRIITGFRSPDAAELEWTSGVRL